MSVGTVRQVEDGTAKDSFDGLRVRAELVQDKARDISDIPWAFPLLPKQFQSVPKVGEAVLVLNEDLEGQRTVTQRFYVGPIISQPQYNAYAAKKDGTSLLQTHDRNPIERVSNLDATRGSLPTIEDVAVVGRGSEDVILRYRDDKTSEVDIRAGIRLEPQGIDNPNMVGNIIFNGVDPSYIQLKYKNGLATRQNHPCTSVVNMVADYINIMSNHDANVSDNLHDKSTLVSEEKMDDVMEKLHQVPMGDKLVELLNIMKGCIMHHVHPWAGMEQCGDWGGYIKQLEAYPIEKILSEYVRIS